MKSVIKSVMKNIAVTAPPPFCEDVFEVRADKIGQSLFWQGPQQPAGSQLLFFTGPVVNYEQIPSDMIRYVVRVDREHYLVPSGIARFANHSCDPNCLINDYFCIETIKPLAPGEEITISYDQVSQQDLVEWGDFWDQRWTFQCQCSTTNCVGLVKGYRIIGNSPPNR